MKQISVLVSAGVHPISGAARYARNDALALSMGLQLQEQQSAQLDVFYAGEPERCADRIFSAGCAVRASDSKQYR